MLTQAAGEDTGNPLKEVKSNNNSNNNKHHHHSNTTTFLFVQQVMKCTAGKQSCVRHKPVLHQEFVVLHWTRDTEGGKDWLLRNLINNLKLKVIPVAKHETDILFWFLHLLYPFPCWRKQACSSNTSNDMTPICQTDDLFSQQAEQRLF